MSRSRFETLAAWPSLRWAILPIRAVADELVTKTVTHFGGLDILVSNAGFADRTAFCDLTDHALTASSEAIQGAFFRLARAAVPTSTPCQRWAGHCGFQLRRACLPH